MNVSCASFGDRAKMQALQVASYLNTPICNVRKYFYSFYTLSSMCKTNLEKISKIAFLSLMLVASALLVPFTAPFAAAIRGGVTALSSKPYIYLERDLPGKVLPDNENISMLSYNMCLMPAGFSITDGGVTPPSDKARIDSNIALITRLDPDIVFLMEVPRIEDTITITERLPQYRSIIPVAGFRAIGPSSMMYVASKYTIDEASIEFVPFEKGREVTGEAQYAEKGVLSFAIRSQEEKIAKIFLTHLQHSEITNDPTNEEQTARALQMRKILDKIEKEEGSCIFAGDLNQEEQELNNFLSQNKIDYLQRDPAIEGRPTWGGNQWCNTLMGKPPCDPTVLDYTFIKGATHISTEIQETGFVGSTFEPLALSDHNPLSSTICLHRDDRHKHAA